MGRRVRGRSDAALDLLRAGRVAEAAALCREALRRDPRDAGALHALGLAALHAGQAMEGVRLIERAVAERAQFPVAWGNLGHARAMLGDHARALDAFDRALAQDPGLAGVHDGRGAALLALGRAGEALKSLDAALAAEPGLAEAMANRALALHALGRLAEALAGFDQALAAMPGAALAHSGRGNVLRDLGRPAEALAAFDACVALAPADPAAHQNRGNALADLGRREDALAAFTRAVALAPDRAEALYNQGNALRALRRERAAAGSYERALAADPAHARAWNNLGLALHAVDRFDEALAAFDKALALRPGDADTWNNRALALRAIGETGAAMAAHDRALALRPDHAGARWNKAALHLALGDLRGGFALFESRWDVPGVPPRRIDDRHKAWTGAEPVEGKRVLIYPEQGLGDIIQFSRYALLLAERGAVPILEVPEKLARLMASMPVRVVVSGEEPPEHDFLVPVMSLPRACRTDEASIPAPVPYLRAEPELVRQWGERLGARTRPRIGLAWSGNPGNAADRKRSMPLSAMLPLTDRDADFFAVHTERAPGDRALMAGRITDLSEDFAGTAALLAHLDLLVTVDTSLAHLGGALGVPTWVLLGHDPDWRWQRDRSDSPWYPTVRLFRQPAPGDWPATVQSVARALRDPSAVCRWVTGQDG